MKWVKFTERKPLIETVVITRTGVGTQGESFESYSKWNNSYLTIKPYPPTHWWDGENDWDLAMAHWYMNLYKQKKIKPISSEECLNADPSSQHCQDNPAS